MDRFLQNNLLTFKILGFTNTKTDSNDGMAE